MRNQKGEVVTGVMVVMMVVMMVLGGMHLMHRGRGDHNKQGHSNEKTQQHEEGHDHEKGHQHEHQGDAGKAPESGGEENR